jgi:putative ABC transport system permease protein
MAASNVFVAVTATTPSSAAWNGVDGVTRVATEYATSSYMRVLGRSVQRGRWFEPADDIVGGAPVAVVTAAAWRTRMGSDPDVVGRTIRLNGQPVTIIGVGPDGLTGSGTPLVTDFWLSISATIVSGDFQVANLQRREDHWYQVLARLAPGVTVPQAQAAMDALAARLAEEYPQFNKGRGITVFASRDVRIHPQGDRNLFLAGGLLSAVVLTVLLLACANLANLLLVRGLSRSGETALRCALGAPRSRVARLFLIEPLLLSGLGGLLGLLVTRVALAAIPALPINGIVGGTIELSIDTRVALFSVALMVFTGVLFGLAPAMRAARADAAQALRDERRGASMDGGSSRAYSVLVAVQVAASLVLVLGTGLVARSLIALQTQDTGVDVDRVAYLRADWSRAGIEGDRARVAIDELCQRIEVLPAVTRAAMVSRLPAEPSGTTTTEVEGYTPSAGTNAVELPFALVTDGYFQTMGIPLIHGRLFNSDDVPGGEGVSIVINQTAARRFWGDANPIGRRMRPQGAEGWTRTVVGVVGDAPVARLGESPRPMFYRSTRQVPAMPSYLVVRTDGDPAAILTSMRTEVSALHPAAVIDAQDTLAMHFGSTLAIPRLIGRAMGAFSVLALLLSGLGIYASVSFSVARRRSELAIRMAMGAERAGVVQMVIREVAGVVVAGLVVGLAVSVLAAPRLGSMLYGVPALDPLAFGGAVCVLLSVAWIAAFVPARRAAGADPMDALRI